MCRSSARTLDRDSPCRALACKLLLVCLTVSGCALSRPEPIAPADFRLGGKIAVRGGAEAFSASFDWAQRGETYDVEFWGPLGQGRVRLRGDAARLTITDARGVTSAGFSVGPFMEAALGWAVPIAALPHWIRGRYDPGSPVAGERRARDGSLTSFEQFGWVVELSRWRPSALGEVPGKIVVSRPGRRILIICKEWSVG